VSSFKGRFSYSVDNKGRIALPLKLRKNISASGKANFVVTRGLDPCLYVYPHDEWNKLEQFFRNLNFLDAQHRNVTRILFESGNDSSIDGQSRISIPQELLQFAQIDKEVLILGVLDRIEIWNPAVYEEYQKKFSDTYESVAAPVFKPQS
jgi:MraZ protein